MDASLVRAGDLIIQPWRPTTYRVLSVEPSPSGKVITIRVIVESTTDRALDVGRPFSFSHRAGTQVLVDRDD